MQIRRTFAISPFGPWREVLVALLMLPILPAPSYAAEATPCGPVSWDRLPSARDMIWAYPVRAALLGIEGRAVLNCDLGKDGALAKCAVEAEEPRGEEFGAAALALTTKMHAAPHCKVPTEVSARTLRIPVAFKLPPGPPYREALFKQPSKEYRWLAPAGPFWPVAALRSGGSGIVIADCRVGSREQLSDCKIMDEPDPKLHFGDAVVAMARKNWMTAAPAQNGVAPPGDNVWRFRVDFWMHKLTVTGGHPIYSPLQGDVR